MNSQDAATFRRSALERLAEPTGSDPSPMVTPRDLSNGMLWALEEIVDQLEILESEGRVKLIRVMDQSEWGIAITPHGRKTLEILGKNWQDRSPQSTAKSPHGQ